MPSAANSFSADTSPAGRERGNKFVEVLTWYGFWLHVSTSCASCEAAGLSLCCEHLSTLRFYREKWDLQGYTLFFVICTGSPDLHCSHMLSTLVTCCCLNIFRLIWFCFPFQNCHRNSGKGWYCFWSWKACHIQTLWDWCQQENFQHR